MSRRWVAAGAAAVVAALALAALGGWYLPLLHLAALRRPGRVDTEAQRRAAHVLRDRRPDDLPLRRHGVPAGGRGPRPALRHRARVARGAASAGRRGGARVGRLREELDADLPGRLLDAIAELPAGAVSLARLCGTPIAPFTVLPVGPRRWRVEVEPPLQPPPRGSGRVGEQELLQRLADRWTAQLRAHAEHWAAVYPMTWRAP